MKLISGILVFLAWLPVAFPVAFCPCWPPAMVASQCGCSEGCCPDETEESGELTRETERFFGSQDHGHLEGCTIQSLAERPSGWLSRESLPVNTPNSCPICGQPPSAFLWACESQLGSDFDFEGPTPRPCDWANGGLDQRTVTTALHRCQIRGFGNRGPLFLIQLSILI